MTGSASLVEGRRRRDDQARRHAAAGRRAIGYKLAFSTDASRQAFGVEEIEYGVLYDGDRLDDGARLSLASFPAARLEPEVALVLDRDLAGPDATPAAAAAAVGELRAAFELVDSRTGSWALTAAALVADNAVACAAVLGSGTDDLSALDDATFSIDPAPDGAAGRHPVRSLVDDPFVSLATLARQLWELDGRGLLAGQFVLTGSCCAPIPLDGLVGRRPGATFGGIGVVHCEVEP